MGKDFLKEVVSEQKLFVIVQSIVLLAILLLVIFAGTADQNTAQKKESICGDGFLDKKENFETCCLDAGCGEGFTCLKGDEEAYTCQNIIKDETTAHIEFLKLGKTLIEQAYNYEEANKELSLSKKLMKKTINDLAEKGFNTDVEEESYNIIVEHVELIETIGKLNKETEALSSDLAFLEVFYLDEGEPKDVENELMLAKNNTQQSINIITSFQNKLKLISPESKKQLTDEFNLDPEIVNIEYDVLLEGFNETNIKASKLLASI